jgi:hypothetical protein
MQRMEPNYSQMHSHFESCIHARIVNVWNLGWKGKQASNWAPETPLEKVLKLRCLKCHRIVHLNLICMSHDQKKSNNQIGNLIPNHKPLESKGQMSSNWGILYIVGKIFLKAIKYYPRIFKINLIWDSNYSKGLRRCGPRVKFGSHISCS